jgi:hypothetical protein
MGGLLSGGARGKGTQRGGGANASGGGALALCNSAGKGVVNLATNSDQGVMITSDGDGKTLFSTRLPADDPARSSGSSEGGK